MKVKTSKKNYIKKDSIETEIVKVFKNRTFKTHAKEALKYIPKIKLENHINNLMAIELDKLPSSKNKYQREYSYGSANSKKKNKRGDLSVNANQNKKSVKNGRKTIEVKYHFEGDILLMKNFSLKDELLYEAQTLVKNKPRGIKNDVPREVLSDIMGAADYFIWHLCLRPEGVDPFGKYQTRIDDFYKELKPSQGKTNAIKF